MLHTDVRLLDRHFGISRFFPLLGLPSPLVTVPQLNNLLVAIAPLHSGYSATPSSGLTFDCRCPGCAGVHMDPPGQGPDRLAQAVPGSFHFSVFNECFDPQPPHTRAGVVLHEAFHARDASFNHDTYAFDPAYPGPQPITNAESFAQFAAVAATNIEYRDTPATAHCPNQGPRPWPCAPWPPPAPTPGPPFP